MKRNKEKPEMPMCDKCRTSKHVKFMGPDTFGGEFRCSKCRQQWAQSW